MSRLFYRDVIINAGGLQIRSRDEESGARPTLKVVFRVERNLARAANAAEISIYNLNEDSRAFLKDQPGQITTIIEAGYVEQRPIIFRGNLDFSRSNKFRDFAASANFCSAKAAKPS